MASFKRKRSAIFFAILMIRFTQASNGLSEQELQERCRLKTSQRDTFPKCMLEMSENSNALWCDQSRYTQIQLPHQHDGIDENVAREIEVLYINDSCLFSIGKGDLSEYHSIQHFVASRNFITRLMESTFSGNGKLLRINLSHNLIVEIERNSFEGLSNLLHLDLSDNEIDDVNMRTFEHLSSLETLSLARNRLAVLHSRSFRHLKALKSLDLSENGILAIRDPFRDLHNLQELILDRNFFGKILTSETFSGISKLQKLSLSFNEITAWPESYGQLFVNLRVLNLSSNFIAKFNHKHLAELKNLSYLSLGNNSLQNMEDNQFTSNENLKFLNLSKNYIEDIAQDAFAPLKQLETLLLEDNRLKTPNKRWFEQLSKQKTPHVNIGGTHWSCNCEIVEFKEFVDQLQDSDNDWNKTLASRLKIICSQPKSVEGEILDENILYDIKNRRECQSGAPIQPKEIPVTHPPTAPTTTKPRETLTTTTTTTTTVMNKQLTPEILLVYQSSEQPLKLSAVSDTGSLNIAIIASLSSAVLIILAGVVICCKLKQIPFERAKSESKRKRNESTKACLADESSATELASPFPIESSRQEDVFSQPTGGIYLMPIQAVNDRQPTQGTTRLSVIQEPRPRDHTYISVGPQASPPINQATISLWSNQVPSAASQPPPQTAQEQYFTPTTVPKRLCSGTNSNFQPQPTVGRSHTVPKRLYSGTNSSSLEADTVSQPSLKAGIPKRGSVDSFQSCKDFSSDFRSVEASAMAATAPIPDVDYGPPSSFQFFSVDSRECGDGAEAHISA